MVLVEIHTSCFPFSHQNQENSLSLYLENALEFWIILDI